MSLLRAFFLTVLAGFVFVAPVAGQDALPPSSGTYATSTEAMTACLAFTSWITAHNYPVYTPCTDFGHNDQGVGNLGANTGLGQAYYGYAAYVAPPQNGACSGMSGGSSWVQGKVLNGFLGVQTFTDPATGTDTDCEMKFTADTPPMTCDTNASGWCTYVSYEPADSAPPPNMPPGTVNGSDGKPVDPPVPNIPASSASSPGPANAPNVCGTSSCYDPNSGQACYIMGGEQNCVNVGKPSGQNGNNPSGCSTSGNATACVGSPAPKPPVTSVPDPSTQVKGSDQYTFADPNTGNPYTQNVTIYGVGNGTVSSGQKPGDLGPASSSSSGKSDGYGGGGDCNTPPVCSGDAVLCGASRTQWASTCQLHTDLSGDGTGAAKFVTDSTKYSQGDAWVTPSTGNSAGDAANNGSYDASGFGYDTSCPMTDLAVPLWGGQTFSVPFSKGCVIGPWVRAMVLAFAAFACVRITAGSRS